MPALPSDLLAARTEEHHAYLESHPEVQSILSDFISASLAEQPADVFEFARSHFARPPLPAPGGDAKKSAWPELVGTSAEAAAQQIRTDRPGLQVVTLAQGSAVSADFKEDRVRLFATDDALVGTPPPRVG
jgi:hypothetical protein